MSSNGTERPEIRFDDKHVDPIMDGEKTVTIRYDFEHEFDQGDIVELVNQNGHKLTTAKIITQCELRADWVTFADFAGHRRYTTTGELLEELSEYYPDANLHPKVVLDVIVFETDLIVTDGGQPTDGTVQSAFASPVWSENAGSGLNSVPPQDAHPFRFPIGRILPFGSSKAAYIDPQSSHAATSRVRSSPFISSGSANATEKHSVRTIGVTRLLVTEVVTDDHSVDTGTERRRE